MFGYATALARLPHIEDPRLQQAEFQGAEYPVR